MAQTGDWITPRLWGEPWFEKPALLYWLTGAAFRAGLGPDVAPRLPVALVSVGFLWFYWWILRREFNARTAQMGDLIIPVLITAYADRTFTFVTKTPPASILLKKAAGLEKGSAEPNRNKVGRVTRDQCREIARTKLPDLNATDIESATNMIAGTARSMGLEVVEA